MVVWVEYAKFFAGLLSIVNPIGSIPIFVNLTANQSPAERHRQVVACTYEMGSAQDRGVGCLMLRFGWKEDEAITAAYAHAYDMRAKAGLMPTAPPADMTPKAGPAPRRPAPAGTHWCQRIGDTTWTTCPN